MKHSLFFALFFFISCFKLLAQEPQDYHTFYMQGLELYEQRHVNAAGLAFKKVITLNPRHSGALYNLGIIQYEAGYPAQAILLLQASARYGSKDAVYFLREHLHQPIAYADTMYIHAVEEKPKLLVDGKERELFDKDSFAPEVYWELHKALKRSKLVRKKIGIGREFQFHLFFNRYNSLQVQVPNQHYSGSLQVEINEIVRKVVKVKSGRHDGKPVVVRGLVLKYTL